MLPILSRGSATSPNVPQIEQDPDDEATQKKRHDHLIVWWGFLLGTTRHRLDQLVDHLADGTIHAGEWAKAFRTEMEGAHTEAWAIGRRLAGDAAPFSKLDQEKGAEMWAKQDEEFFRKFVEDVNNGRYTDAKGELLDVQVRARSRQYATSLKGTINRAFGESLPKTDKVTWNLGVAEHCDDCLEWASGSPYTPETLPAYPGDGTSECKVNCKCFLEAEGGYSTKGI